MLRCSQMQNMFTTAKYVHMPRRCSCQEDVHKCKICLRSKMIDVHVLGHSQMQSMFTNACQCQGTRFREGNCGVGVMHMSYGSYYKSYYNYYEWCVYFAGWACPVHHYTQSPFEPCTLPMPIPSALITPLPLYYTFFFRTKPHRTTMPIPTPDVMIHTHVLSLVWYSLFPIQSTLWLFVACRGAKT